MKLLVFWGTVRGGGLPVSAMIHAPKAQEVFTEHVSPQIEVDRDSWYNYFVRTFNQLICWAQAAREHRAQINPQLVGDFKMNPSERKSL